MKGFPISGVYRSSLPKIFLRVRKISKKSPDRFTFSKTACRQLESLLNVISTTGVFLIIFQNFQNTFNKNNGWQRLCLVSWASNCVNSIVSNTPFLYPLKTSEKLPIFWCFQEVEKGSTGNKWVNVTIILYLREKEENSIEGFSGVHRMVQS